MEYDARDFYSDQPPRKDRTPLSRPSVEPNLDWQNIPIYITNRNNLERGFRRLVTWLLDAGMKNIRILDNLSTYKPLLDYYVEMSGKIEIIFLDKNYGPWVFWEKKLYTQISGRYIVSDADVVPDRDCPKDLVKKMSDIFDRYLPLTLKVGPGIRVDNLPDHYVHKQKVLLHEQFSIEANRGKGDENDVYCAIIDTTFAMYGEHSPFPDWAYHFRLAPPYVLEHAPWYEDSNNPSEEYKYCMERANLDFIHW